MMKTKNATTRRRAAPAVQPWDAELDALLAQIDSDNTMQLTSDAPALGAELRAIDAQLLAAEGPGRNGTRTPIVLGTLPGGVDVERHVIDAALHPDLTLRSGAVLLECMPDGRIGLLLVNDCEVSPDILDHLADLRAVLRVDRAALVEATAFPPALAAARDTWERLTYQQHQAIAAGEGFQSWVARGAPIPPPVLTPEGRADLAATIVRWEAQGAQACATIARGALAFADGQPIDPDDAKLSAALIVLANLRGRCRNDAQRHAATEEFIAIVQRNAPGGAA